MNEDRPRQNDDRRLIEAVVQGQQDAFAALYDRLSGPLYAMCLRMTGDAAEAEDILQEACLTIWRRAPSYDAMQSSVFSWAVHLTRCKAIDHLRSRGRRLRVMVPEEGSGDHENGGGKRAAETMASDGPGAADTADSARTRGPGAAGAGGTACGPVPGD